MTSNDFPRRSSAVTLLMLTTMIVVSIWVGAHWIQNFRDPLMLDIDEAGYLRFALGYLRGLDEGGVEGWLRAVLWPSPHSPIVPAVTSLVFAATGPSVGVSFWVPMAALGVAAIGTFALSARLTASRGAGLLAALLVLTCPSLVIYSRDYHFSVPATALLVLVVWAATESKGFARRGWSIAFGVILGLLPLTRTMTLAFIPGLLVGYGLHALALGVDKSRVLNAALAGLGAVLVASVWFVPSGALVATYLLSFGYGNRAVDYGPPSSVFDPTSWVYTLQVLLYMTYVPHFLVLVAGWGGLLVKVGLELARSGWAICLRVLRSPLFPLMVTIGAGLAALTSSSNKGSAFMAPLLPLAFAVAVTGLFSLAGWWRRASAVASVAACVLAFVPMLDARSDIADPVTIALPVVGGATWSSGQGEFERYYAKTTGVANAKADPVPKADRAAWAALINDLAAYLRDRPQQPVVFGLRHFLINSNLLLLQDDLAQLPPRRVWGIDPYQMEPTEASYERWLTETASEACILLVSEGTVGEFLPGNNAAALALAAARSGFVVDRSLAMPGERRLDVWIRRSCGAPE